MKCCDFYISHFPWSYHAENQKGNMEVYLLGNRKVSTMPKTHHHKKECKENRILLKNE